MTGTTIIINRFFEENYHVLVQKCRDYARVYHYKALAPDELISELYLYTLNNANRTNKLEQLILLSAATLSKVYSYSSVAFYYISRTLYNITHGHRSFDNNCNRRHFHLTFEQDIERIEIPDSEYEEQNDYCDVEIIYKKALELSTGDNWWRYKVWYDYYKNKMTYKDLSLKYRLTITPLFYAVRDFNKIIQDSLRQSERSEDHN